MPTKNVVNRSFNVAVAKKLRAIVSQHCVLEAAERVNSLLYKKLIVRPEEANAVVSNLRPRR